LQANLEVLAIGLGDFISKAMAIFILVGQPMEQTLQPQIQVLQFLQQIMRNYG
jgi:hypothetical protein